MPYQYDRQLIDYLDNNLSEHEVQAIEELINTNHAVHERWQYLQTAVQGVQYAALHAQVAAVRKQYTAPKGKVRKLSMVFRIAAVFVLLITGIAVYKFITTSAADLYNDAYQSYALNTSRGAAASNQIAQAYRNKNWNEVQQIFNKTAEKDNKVWFLAGMANMELQQYEAATHQFEQVLMHNARTGDDYFQDEAEYYLAMSFLAQNKVKEAITMLKKIKDDTGHLFNKQADRISDTDLKIVLFKSGK